MKSVIYIIIFVEIQNQHSRKRVQEIYKIVKLKKYSILRVKNPLNLDSQ